MKLSEIPLDDLIGELERRRTAISKTLDCIRLSTRNRSEVDAVIDAVCNAWEISKPTIFAQGRQRFSTDPRQAAMEIMRNHLQLTFETVGAIFNKDHGTVIHACNSHQARMSDKEFKRRYKAALHDFKKHSLKAAGLQISTH